MRTVFLAQGSDQRVASLLPNSTTSITHALVEDPWNSASPWSPHGWCQAEQPLYSQTRCRKEKAPSEERQAGFGLQRSRSAATLVGSYLIKPPLHPAINSLASMVPSLSVSNVVKSNV